MATGQSGSQETKPVKPPPPMPPALLRQKALAHSRAAAELVFPDDSASMISAAGSQASSASWLQVNEAPLTADKPEAVLTVIPESAQDQQEIQQGAHPTTSGAPMGQEAPATQAARNLLGGVNEQQPARRLRRQQERAKGKWGQSIRWGQMTAPVHNALNFQLPTYLRQIGSGRGERSVLVVDSRDQRMQSPYQGWLLDEILVNAQAGVNILTDRQLVRSPSSGYHMNICYVRTLDGQKLIFVGSMSSYSSVPCAKWDADTGKVLSHQAFQPFRWPVMRDDSSTWVDIKVKIEGSLLLHLELRGYRTDRDMTVQLNYVNDALVMGLADLLFIPSVVVTIFQGWRVVATSFEVGGRLYACSDGGVVVALDYPLCHFELRMVAISSADAFGTDADRLEFRFASAGDKLEVACSSVTVPSTWLVVSRFSGPTLIRNAEWCRRHMARIEGPDQVMQLSQLAGIHAHWTAAIEAKEIRDVGPRVGAIAVDSHEQNFHLTCESPLFKQEKAIVPREALALQFHNPELERATMILPPVTGGPSAQPISEASGRLRSLVGPSASSAPASGIKTSELSMTEPGEAPLASSSAVRPVHVMRRSLDARLGDSLAAAAVTPKPLFKA